MECRLSLVFQSRQACTGWPLESYGRCCDSEPNKTTAKQTFCNYSPLWFYHIFPPFSCPLAEAVDMNGRFQMQGGKNWFLPKEMNANRFFWDCHWLEIWSNHFYPSMGPNGGSVAMDSGL